MSGYSTSSKRHRRLACCVGALLLGVSALAWAQFKPANPKQTQAGSPAQVPARPPEAPNAPEASNAPQSGGDQPRFSIRVNLVRLLVSVRDQSGAIVANLKKQDFCVTDSGVTQDIAVFEQNTSLPLSVAILVDTSGSTQLELHNETASVLKFIPQLLGAGNPEDTFALFSFNWRTNLEVDFSRNLHRAERAVHQMHGEGGTSLYDAIYLASDTLAEREGRHVMVVITDGGDTTSYKKYPEALAAAQRSDVVLYPLVVVPIVANAGRNTGGEHALATLAASTGGRIFYPAGFDRLDEAFADIIRELRTQYLIGFYPKDVYLEPRRYHPVTVTVRDRAAHVTTRSGYYEP